MALSREVALTGAIDHS